MFWFWQKVLKRMKGKRQRYGREFESWMFSNDETVKVTKMKSKFYLGTYEPVLISLLFIFNEVQSK